MTLGFIVRCLRGRSVTMPEPDAGKPVRVWSRSTPKGTEIRKTRQVSIVAA